MSSDLPPDSSAAAPHSSQFVAAVSASEHIQVLVTHCPDGVNMITQKFQVKKTTNLVKGLSLCLAIIFSVCPFIAFLFCLSMSAITIPQ